VIHRSPPRRNQCKDATNVYSFRTEQRKQDGFPDSGAGQQHHQAVDAHAHAPGRRHAELHRLQEGLIEVHRLGIALRGKEGLLHEAFALDRPIISPTLILLMNTPSNNPNTIANRKAISPLRASGFFSVIS